MKTYTKKELDEILEKHAEYLMTGNLELKANLSSTNLRYADLSYADLRSANLRSANLIEANIYCTGWNLGCGSLNIKECDIDLVYQLLYHAASLPACTEEIKELIKPFANKFKLVGKEIDKL